MRPVTTSQYLIPHCQCIRAAFASVLEIPIEKTPTEDAPNTWTKWAAPFNATLVGYDLPLSEPIPGYAVGFVDLGDEALAGMHSSGTLFDGLEPMLHAVVLCGGKVVHDPHRDQCALRMKPSLQHVLFPIDPAKPMTFGELNKGALTERRRAFSSLADLRFANLPNRRREFVRRVRWKRAQNRAVNRLLESWAEIDVEDLLYEEGKT